MLPTPSELRGDRYVLPFLRAVFPAEAQGYVRFLTGTPGHFPQGAYFLTVSELHQCQVLPFPTEGMEVYFTPHTFSRAAIDVTKADALEMWCCWMECDDENFSPMSILPNSPSAVIETSPGRTHAYWFLKAPAEGAMVEAVNRTMAYKYLTKDIGGWALTKLLRVPGQRNHKYDPPAHVELLTFETGRRYSIHDFEQTPPEQFQALNGDIGDPPQYTKEAADKVRAQWGPQLPQAMVPLLTQRQRDRSKALWHMANHCCRIGMRPDEAFLLLHDSPNNKFLDNRFNAAQGLWRDILNAYRNSTNVDRQGALGRIRQLRQQRGIPNDVRYDETAKLVYRTMALEGHFYYSRRTAEALYYQHQPYRLINLAVNNQECQTFLGTQYLLNGTTPEYKFVAEYLRAQCEAEAPTVKLRDLSYYDRECLYVSDFKGGIYRLDGDKIEYVLNGVDDGVFFRHPHECEPYSPDFSGTLEDLDSVFRRVQLATVNYPADKARFFIKTWFLALFFSDVFATRPLLILEGSKGSGKSFAFKVMDIVLRGTHGRVYSLPPSPREFRIAVREKTSIFFDGVDEPFKGLAELLSTVATGTVDRVRLLYTDNRIAEYEMRAFIGISTMNAYWLRHDLADRSIVLRTQRRDTFESEDILVAEVLRARNKIWGALLKELNRIVKLRRTFKPVPTNMRMADYAAFLQLMCQLYGEDPEWYVKFAVTEQAQQVLSRSPLWDALRLWLSDERNIDRLIPASDLHNELIVAARRGNVPYLSHVSTSKALGQKLSTLGPSMYCVREVWGDRWAYRFQPEVRELLSGGPR